MAPEAALDAPHSAAIRLAQIVHQYEDSGHDEVEGGQYERGKQIVREQRGLI